MTGRHGLHSAIRRGLHSAIRRGLHSAIRRGPRSAIRHGPLGRSGASAVEFALVVPLFMMFLLGVVQVGIVFFNYTSLQNAMSAGAREATLFPQRSDLQIRDKITEAGFGLDAARLTTPTIVRGTDNGQDYVDLTARYQVTLDIGLIKLPAFELEQSRRAYLP